MRRAFLAGLAFVVAAPALAREAPPPAGGPGAKAVTAFTVDVLRTAAASGGNTFLSPYSIATAMAMARAGAKGATAAELDAALHLPPDAPAAFRELVTALAAPPRVRDGAGDARTEVPAYSLSVANGLFVHRGFPVEPAFGATLRDGYAVELAEVNFEDGAAARKAINAWVAANTRDRIHDIVPPGLPTPDTRLALANAIHFQAAWAEPFPADATAPKPFHVAPGRDVTAPRMARTAVYAWAETDDATLVELPYRGGATSMVVVLPKAADGLDAVVRALTAERLDAAIAAFERRRVAVELPKLSFTSSLDVGPVLRALGVNAAFDPAAADFTGMTAKRPLFLGPVLHKAFVAVDEAGTEAAAATVVMMRAGSAAVRAGPTPFVVDHPFLFLLRHRATGTVLFACRVVDPTAS